MNSKVIVLCVLILLGVVLGKRIYVDGEGFSSSGSSGSSSRSDTACPTEAVRGPDGRIHTKPGNRSFQTLSDYVGYLSDLYANGATCIPPKVRPNREPIAGILGGLGNGVQPPSASNMEGPTRNVLETAFGEEGTSAKTPIQKLDDYEYTRVFDVERGSRNSMKAASKNEQIQSHVLDWANLPFNSEERANNEDTFIAGRMESGFRDPKSGVFFNTVEGDAVVPPDVEAAHAREQKIMAAYKPTEISKHTIDSDTEAVASLVNKLYATDPNWEPVVTKVSDHQWEINELRPKPRKEQYEDKSTISLSMAENNGIAIPPPVVDINDRMRDDPYFDKNGLGDRDNNKFWNYNDFRTWTPGLERMFAPTADTKEWN